MKLTVIGCGNANSKINFNQSFLLEDKDNLDNTRRLLIDCGRAIPEALDNAGYSFKDITDIYISHQHADHIGSLEMCAFERYDWMGRPERYDDYKKLENIGNLKPYAPVLYAQKELMKSLWKKSLSGGLESMEGFNATLETFFETKAITNKFKWCGWTCELIQQMHIVTGSRFSPTFGLMMSKAGHKTIYFTTDAQHCSPKQVRVFYEKADVIIQDCECLPFKSGVHANYIELAGHPNANAEVLPDSIKAKMWLSHYQDFVSEGKTMAGVEFDWEKQAINDGFLGFIHLGDIVEV